ncbi:hypothetical protein BU26DRAFT_599956 [Trematosphaeria pertusa]|uniref:Uncharacterized protein n=1 Tax=Trematosphaeria pertusa TaxID=390896 RepID=A0A6A6J3R6_9PLEO|nr:uncharacterized protein BU26DRAFT_599956 [Trematosphaeria pertusa]KAF2257464.1 hypothetical protein BU26DRAFT_599956 [Trematosphaeria pertusa]
MSKIGTVTTKEAVAKIQRAIDNDKLFKNEDLNIITQISISNMTHTSSSDPNSHYSVVGYDGNNQHVTHSHVQQDESKQRRAN